MTSHTASEKSGHARKRKSMAAAVSVAVDDDMAGPIEAGMRARAIADACERWALPAIFLDRVGRVLHVGAAAQSFLGGKLAVLSGHLVSNDPAANRAVGQAVADALGSEQSAGQGGDASDDAGLNVIGLRYDDPSPFQMLRGVLVLGRPDTNVLALRNLLAA